jgi:AcrR family transcriptional regulator
LANNKNTQELLLQAATELFYKKGYADTSVREVGAKAGVSNSLLYHYFKDKEEMLFQIITNTVHDLLKVLEEIDKDVKDPIERLKDKLVSHMILFGMKRRKESKIVVEEHYYLRGKRREASANYEKEIFAMYMKDLVALQADGKLKDINPTVLAFSIFGIINWFFRWYKDSGRLSQEEVANNILKFMLHGMLAEDLVQGGVTHE